MIDSRFIHLIRTDSNALFLRLSNIPLYICNTVEEEEGGMNGESSWKHIHIHLNMQTQLQKALQNRKDSTIKKLLRDT